MKSETQSQVTSSRLAFFVVVVSQNSHRPCSLANGAGKSAIIFDATQIA